MDNQDFAHPNDLDAERRLIAVLCLMTDERRPQMLARLYSGLFVHPLYRWMFQQVADAAEAGNVTWDDMMKYFLSQRWEGRQVGFLIADLWINVDGTDREAEVAHWTADFHTLHQLAIERYREHAA